MCVCCNSWLILGVNTYIHHLAPKAGLDGKVVPVEVVVGGGLSYWWPLATRTVCGLFVPSLCTWRRAAAGTDWPGTRAVSLRTPSAALPAWVAGAPKWDVYRSAHRVWQRFRRLSRTLVHLAWATFGVVRHRNPAGQVTGAGGHSRQRGSCCDRGPPRPVVSVLPALHPMPKRGGSTHPAPCLRRRY